MIRSGAVSVGNYRKKNTRRVERKYLNSGDRSVLGGTKSASRAWDVWLPMYPLAGSMAMSILFSGYVG